LLLDPLSPSINASIADNLSYQERYDESLAQYKKLIEINPTSHLGYEGLASLYFTVFGQIDEAMVWLKKAYRYDSDNPEHIAEISLAYCSLGDEVQAEHWINQALQTNPYHPYLLLCMAYLEAFLEFNIVAN